MKIGSLFDGSGGFPLAATMCGIEPVWAAEIEPYPIAVTCSRFPSMKHLGSVTDIRGDEIEPVDVITFGSPCQDLSVAGKRAGLKHTENGDDETTRSGLFMEAIRIIKEMREATNGVYPRIAVWENVPGAFSSNKGEDFRIVLEEFIKVAEPTAVMPEVPKAGWPYADVYCGDDWSLAYRVLDAQYWGVPQRRRRIYLVADFRGQRAGKVSFEREGLRGYFAESGAQREGIAGDAASGIGAAGFAGRTGNSVGFLRQLGGVEAAEERSPTLMAAAGMSGNNKPCVAYGISSYESNSMKSANPLSGIYVADTSRTLDLNGGSPACNQGGIAIVEPVYCLQGNMIGRADKNGPQGDGVNEEVSFTCNTIDRHAVAFLANRKDTVGTLMANAGTKMWLGNQEAFSGDYSIIEERGEPVRYIVRRLTPTECARLQGFPDEWGHIDQKSDFTDEEYAFWLEVRNTHAAINGKVVKDYTKQQMLTWYNKLHTDSSEYKMWGNGIALPCALYVMQGIAEVLNEN